MGRHFIGSHHRTRHCSSFLTLLCGRSLTPSVCVSRKKLFSGFADLFHEGLGGGALLAEREAAVALNNANIAASDLLSFCLRAWLRTFLNYLPRQIPRNLQDDNSSNESDIINRTSRCIRLLPRTVNFRWKKLITSK